MKTNYVNLLITDRDMSILKLLLKLKIAESDLLRDLISPETSQNTFTKRLKKLEEKGFIEAINQDRRGRTQNKLYRLNPKKKADIEAIAGMEFLGWTVNMSYSIYFHTLYIGYFVRFLVKRIKKKNPSYVFEADNLISQYEFQKRITTTKNKNENRSSIIPDWLLKVGNSVRWIEIERMNSNKEFLKKVKGYKDRYFYLQKEGFCPFFPKDAKHSLLVMAPEPKREAYKSILETEKMKDYYGLQLIPEDVVLKNQ